jgi:hypothetical protein
MNLFRYISIASGANSLRTQPVLLDSGYWVPGTEFLTPTLSPYIKRGMKTIMRTLTIISAVILLAGSAGADPSSFPSNGLDAQSLGRGGTVIACPPGVWSAFGNPATLTPEGYYVLGIDYVDRKDAPKSSWGLSILDTSSAMRGAVSYYTDPEFAGFTNEMWGVSFSQTLMPSLYLGESFHMGDYEPDASPGSEESLSTVDAGLLYKLGSNVSIGYVVHNLFPDDRDLLKQYNGFGIGLQFPMTIYFAADYEEDPDPVSGSERNLRTGIEFNPAKKFTGRLGYQDLANGETYMTLGITYTDINGTLDAGILYNEQTDKTDRVVLGLSMRM